MQVLEKHDNILRDEYDLDMISGKLVSDDTIERGHRADSVRGNKGIWTPLDNTLMPKAIVISLNKNLKSISDKIIHSNGRDLIHVLCDTRDYIHLYFNHTKQNPVRIAEYTR